MAKRAKPKKAQAKSRKVYVRIGTWHPSETSRNYATGNIEAGVSVFDAVKTNGKYRILLDHKHDPDGRLADTLSGLVAEIKRKASYALSGDPIYLVRGTHVGIGYDGDTLFKDLVIDAEITADDLLAPEIGLT